jgi:hypothetical protein
MGILRFVLTPPWLLRLPNRQTYYARLLIQRIQCSFCSRTSDSTVFRLTLRHHSMGKNTIRLHWLNDPLSIHRVTIRLSRSRLNGQDLDFICFSQNLPCGKGHKWESIANRAQEKTGKPLTSQLLLYNMRDVTISSTWILTAEESRMSAFPDTDTRYAEVLAARRVPREQWRNYQNGCGSTCIFAISTATVPPIPRAFSCL